MAALTGLRGAITFAAAVMVGAGFVGSPIASADPLSTPAMSAGITANPDPISFDAGPIGTIYVGGDAGTFIDWQASRFRSFPSLKRSALAVGFYDDRDFRWDVSNAQIFVQKDDGPVQFYAQAGAYDILAVGYVTFPVGMYTADTYGPLPIAYLKLVPTDNFSILAGKLPGLVAVEKPFDFENLNIERGLLWLQEPAISRGVQANYALGPVALSASFNDGNYSDTLDWVTGRLTWTIDSTNTFAIAGGGHTATQNPSYGSPRFLTPSAGTPPAQQNSSIINATYTYSNGPWMISPTVEWSDMERDAKIGFRHGETSWSGAALLDYRFDPNWSVALRGEYIKTAGKFFAFPPTPISEYILYGPRSSAASFTLTPTYQYKLFYARAEASYLLGWNGWPTFTWFGFGGIKQTQLRGLLEIGVQF